ncbi:MAG: FadR/GntR family transcriptional regulator [Acidimicrobiales bacterium]
MKVPESARSLASTLFSAPDRVNGGPRSKLAASVATRIVKDVAVRDWPVGEVIGSEAELLERYGVSRAVFREAVRLVEHQHVARMRRGPGGGLVVTEPDVDAIIDAAVIYLLRAQARLDEVFEARLVLEQIVTQLAPGRVREADLVKLRELIGAEAQGTLTDHRELHSLLASITRNPALELFVECLNRLSLFYFSDRHTLGSPTLDASAHAHRRIAEAVIGGNEGLARQRMAKHLRAEAEFIRGRRGARQILKPSAALRGPPGSKRAEALAREIFGEVITSKLQPGDLLGSETELMEQYGVSRAVWREAVRILEHHDIAVMRRGPHGGLFVSAPSVAAVSEVVAVYLERRGTKVSHLAELRVGVELAVIDLVIDRSDDDVVAVLGRTLEAEGAATVDDLADVAHDLHAVLAELSGNRALELIVGILIRLTRLHQTGQLSDPANRTMSGNIRRTHSGIVDTLVAGDRELARHRMRRHLEAVTGVLR